MDIGKTLYTPYLPPPPPTSSSSSSTTQPKAEMKMLRLYSEEDLAHCPLDKWGILDPGTHRREVGKESESREDGTCPLHESELTLTDSDAGLCPST